ncbi:DUF7210 family protein [Marinobacterium stanieri]|uniref:DUF7210 domain-containing protein n=1 Tax=Marinobacterium stanieri TaxID=49186 RepID=A0A1N6RQ17_9GAMM|nr:hypothetical protein [Marinobacterium stanieri]SIQ30913.1 hypothetical protein SAMN05421647_103459 [Marinobacterium stanieri]
MSIPKKPVPATVEVTLLKEHTHNGQKLQKDAKIKVTASQRKFLIDREIIAANSPEPAKATTTKAKG